MTSYKRWLYKAITWKTLSTIMGAAIVYLLTGGLLFTVSWLVIHVPATLGAYFVHEWVWSRGRRSVDSAWGSFRHIASGDGYIIKELTVKPSCTMSYQQHEHRIEHWSVQKGTLSMLLEGEDLTLEEGQEVFVGKMEKHAAYNNTNEDVVVVEIWQGDDLREDDILRSEYPEGSYLGDNNWVYGNENDKWALISRKINKNV